MKKRLIKNIAQAFGAIAFLVGVWIAAWAAVGNELLVPSFSDSVKAFFSLFINGGFWKGFLQSLSRVAIAFCISFVFAAALAVVAYLYPAFAKFFAPIAAVIRSMPVLAVLLIVLVWTGAGVAPVVVAFLSLFPLLYTGTLSALKGIDGELIEMSRVYRVGLKTRIAALYLLNIAPQTLRQAGAALAFGVKLVLSAEVLSRTAGSLGNMMQDAQIFSEMPLLFALVAVACAAGFLFETAGEAAARALERRWR